MANNGMDYLGNRGMKRLSESLLTSHSCKESAGLYVHVPFCRSKCPYCDFNSVAVSGSEGRLFEESRFIDSICTELNTLVGSGSNSFAPSTLYFGGGTPSLLSPSSIVSFLDFLKSRTGNILPGEITMEVNPESATQEKLQGYRSAGVNRLSIGVQSFNDDELRQLGRPHTAKAAIQVFKDARAAGFDNIGIDLIFGLPGRTLESWKVSLEKAVELNPEHISLYGLTIEPDTPFFDLYSGGPATEPHGVVLNSSGDKGGVICGESGVINDELYVTFYSTAIERLTEAGYEQYEISNFAKCGRESRHNSLYWSGAGYIGLGPGAHSLFLDTEWGRRSANVADVEQYFNTIENGGTAVEMSETLNRESALLEAVMLGLRRVKHGLEADRFETRFGQQPIELLNSEGSVERLIGLGLLLKDGKDLRLTSRGILVSDTVIAQL